MIAITQVSYPYYAPYTAAVTLPQKDTAVTLTLTLTYNGREDLKVSKVYTVNVKGSAAVRELDYQELLETALTHTSYANESRTPVKHNERLEFLGDSVLQIVSADYLFHAYADRPEGDLTRIRASLVSEGALFQFAQEIDLGEYLRLGRGEERCGGRTRPSVVSDAFEAVIAALYLDGGMEVARKFILPFITEGKHAEADYKTRLQEIVQQNPEERLSYVVESESGPDHDKHFVVAVRFNSDRVARGEGRSKKAAEQCAAKEALKLLGVIKEK